MTEILNDDEQRKLIMSLANARGVHNSFTEQEAFRLIELCETDILGATMVRMAIAGELLVDVVNDELVYSTRKDSK